MNDAVRVLVEHYDLVAPGKFAHRNGVFVHGNVPVMLVFNEDSVTMGELSQAEHTLFRNKGVAWMPTNTLINKVMRTTKMIKERVGTVRLELADPNLFEMLDQRLVR